MAEVLNTALPPAPTRCPHCGDRFRTPAELAGTTFAELSHPDDVDADATLLARTLAGVTSGSPRRGDT